MYCYRTPVDKSIYFYNYNINFTSMHLSDAFVSTLYQFMHYLGIESLILTLLTQ